jgi:hypothetical protein
MVVLVVVVDDDEHMQSMVVGQQWLAVVDDVAPGIGALLGN